MRSPLMSPLTSISRLTLVCAREVAARGLKQTRGYAWMNVISTGSLTPYVRSYPFAASLLTLAGYMCAHLKLHQVLRLQDIVVSVAYAL